MSEPIEALAIKSAVRECLDWIYNGELEAGLDRIGELVDYAGKR